MELALSRQSLLGLPWVWAGVGTASCFLGAGLSRAVGGPIVGILIVVGLLLVAIGMTIRLNSNDSTRVNSSVRSLFLAILTVIQLAVAGLATWSLIAAFVGLHPFRLSPLDIGQPRPLHPGLGIIVWLMIAPMAVKGALSTVTQFGKSVEWTWAEDVASLFLLSSTATFASGYALTDADGFQTLPVFLSVATAFLATMVSFPLLSKFWQRVYVSAAIVLHFSAIGIATLAAPPSSWILGQMWTRFSRPYLEFMYLNNAYHFYSPDPGPATYLWFRVFYDTGIKDETTGEPKLNAEWVKIPDLDDDGSHRYKVALQYQRHLSLTENIIATEPTPPLYFRSADGKSMPQPQPFFAARIYNSPDAALIRNEQVVGREMPKYVMEVPFHQFIPNEQQYAKPNLSSRRMLQSYVRQVAKQAEEKTQKGTLHSIKVYKVTHIISPWNVFVNGAIDANDLEYYRPYYLGEYVAQHDKDGKLTGQWDLKDPNEPLLYWLLPILRRNATRPESAIESYAHKHARDPNYIYNPSERRWADRDLGAGKEVPR
jgi:hypothetical protein